MKISAITKNDLNKLGTHEKDGIRQLRKPLLQAFDIYKSNVNYGVETETAAEKAAIMEWYNKLLNLDKTALENIPEKIKRYL